MISQSTQVAKDTVIPKKTTAGPYPLSFAQEQVWYLDQLEPNSPRYNVAEGLRLRGDLDPSALEKSLNFVISRHDALRTNFILKNGTPVQIVGSYRNLQVEVTDLTGLPEQSQMELVQLLGNREAQRPFDLSWDMLIRTLLFRLGPTDHVLILTIHHAVYDLWSRGILYRELTEAYRAFVQGRFPEFNNLPIQYPDFALWERERLQGENLESLNTYWKSALDGSADTYHLLPDRPRPPRMTSRGATESGVIPANVASALLRLSNSQSVTQFMTLMGAFQVLLHRYSCHEDISVGFPIANRPAPEVANLIGFFVNTLVLKCNYAGNPTFTEVLRRVREASLGAYLHHELPFEKMVNVLRAERNPKQTPLFQVMFVLKNTPPAKLLLPDVEVTRFDVETNTSKFDLTVLVDPQPDMRITFEYNEDLFDASTMSRLLGHYQNLLTAVASNPEVAISDLPLMSPSERTQIMEEWNETARPIPQTSIQELFEQQAVSTPDSVAVVFADEQLTYRELNERANALAYRLKTMGVKPEVKVGICVQRSLDLIVGLLGILKAGGAYVPLDPDYPQERIEFILRDADIRVLLTQTAIARCLPTAGLETINLDTFTFVNAAAEENLPIETTPQNLAYVIYTSGSTGKPKGVEILHRGVVRLVFGQDYINFDAKQVILHMASVSFDASTFEVWAPLLHGGRCVLFPGSVPTAHDLSDAIRKHKVTTLWLTSTLFNALIDDAPDALAPVRRILVGGEALSVPHINRALKLLPGTEIINGYGPTEATTFATTYRIPQPTNPGVASIPIGKPIANTQVYILDKCLQPVPIGVPGELYIGGPGLARGYLKRPDLTAQKFIPHPFSSNPADRLYKTGDTVRWLAGGVIEYLGRMDDQVKVRGFRIELGEIEAALATHPEIKSVAVVMREQASIGKTIVAYASLRNGHKPAAGDMHSFLKDKLPEYMLPSDFVFLSAMPLTRSGKIDRRALPAPGESGSESRKEFVGPRDHVEMELVKIWENLLGKKPISVRDDFYDLGGHSLLAVRAIAAIERAFGKKLHLAAWISTPTIEQLAAGLREDHHTNSSMLVAIQGLGTKPPMFCVHGGGGEVIRFVALARELGSDQPFYGLRSPEFNGDHSQVTVEFLAEKYIHEIRTIQPEGPYYLSGASFGGLVAFEMAKQLSEQGAQVALLALFDTGNPAFHQSLPIRQSLKHRALLIGAKLKDHWTRLLRANPQERPGMLFQTVRSLKARLDYLVWGLTCRYFDWRRHPLPARLRDNVKLFTAVANRYRPQRYSGKVTLFKAAEQKAEFGPDPEMGWGCVAGAGVEVYEVPGDHMTILDQPRVVELAERLSVCLDAARKVEA